MKSMDIGDSSDEEVTLVIASLAFRIGREPYMFYNADGDPWAVLVRADDYEELVDKAEQLELLQAIACAPSEDDVSTPN